MKTIKCICAVLVVVFLTVPIYETAFSTESIAEMQKKKTEIEAKEKDATEKLEQIKKEKQTLATEIEALDIEIGLAEDKLEYTRDRLSTVMAEHEQTEKELVQAEEDKDRYYIALKKRLKYIQENGKIGYYQVLFNSKGFGDFLNRVEYVNDIIAYDQTVYSKLIDVEKTIAEKKLEIEGQLDEIQILLVRQEEELQTLNDAHAAKDALMAEALSNEELYNEQISLLEQESSDLGKKIKEAQEEADRQARARAAAAAAAARNSAPSSSSSSNRLPASSGSGVAPSGQMGWPVTGYYTLSSGYVNRTNPITGKKEFHTGIDIPAPKGTNILAAESGTVILAGTNGGYGLCVVVDHGNGVSTLYGHNSSLVVSVGETVSRGQTIAKCGSTGMSTGNHCHFEVRINGSPTNPGPYVGL